MEIHVPPHTHMPYPHAPRDPPHLACSELKQVSWAPLCFRVYFSSDPPKILQKPQEMASEAHYYHFTDRETEA